MTTTKRRPRDDRGATLLELMITVGIMSVVMVVVTGAIMQIYRSVNKNEALSTAKAELNHVFTRLDKEIRYASGISKPSPPGDDRYVEYQTTNTGTTTCVQLRLRSTGELQRRSWPSAGTPGPWSQLASGISGVVPFTTYPAGDFAFQRLRVNVNATIGSGASRTTRQTDITFTALNTSVRTESDTVCNEGRLVP
jgi:Tfp pilus assembly protein PilE